MYLTPKRIKWYNTPIFQPAGFRETCSVFIARTDTIVLKSLFISMLLLFTTASLSLSTEAGDRRGSDIYVLFDRSKEEGRSGIEWAIDDDEPAPMPEQPWGRDTWSGSLSALALRLFMTGRYSLETLPPAGSITWLKGDNPHDLSLYDIFIVCEPRSGFSPAEISAIKAFVEAGSALLLVAGFDARDEERDISFVHLNEFLSAVLEEDPAREFRFKRGLQPRAGSRSLPEDQRRGPVTGGPFGTVSRLTLRWGLGLTFKSPGDGLMTGPDFGDGIPLFVVFSMGAGKIAMVIDPCLLDPGKSTEKENDNLTLSLNLISYLVDDLDERYRRSPFTFTRNPDVDLVTDDGASIFFQTGLPSWTVVELKGRKESVHFFRDVEREHDIRLENLKPDVEYSAILHVFDRWGKEQPLQPPLAFRTIPPSRIEYGDVVISEIFWGGEDQYIELHNSLDRVVDLKSWTLMNNEIRYSLRGICDAKSYYLVSRFERDDAGRNCEVYEVEREGLYLDPEGDFVILQDEEGNVVSTANINGERWPAGRMSPESASMERIELGGPDEAGNWDTALVNGRNFQGTPGHPNSRRSVRVFNPVFYGGIVEGGIRLSWEHNIEDSVVGVNIYRSTIRDGWEDLRPVEYTKCNDNMIPPDIRIFLDTDLRNDITYQYMLGVVCSDGNELFSDPITISSKLSNLPTYLKVEMGQNFPNPFNPQTEINYSIEESEGDRIQFPLRAEISIFNVRGQQIRKLQEREVWPGDYSTRWDGRDDNGEPVSSGSYYYRLTLIRPSTQEIVQQLSKKMVLLR